MPPPELPDFPASQLFLRRLAYSLVHDEARAEDLVQDTWAAWVEHRPRGVTEPKAWLARVLRNRAFNLKRGDERRAQRESFAGRPDPSTPETDGTLEAQAKLIEALRELEEPYRSTLVQRYYHDLAPKEIAERAGAPLNTVKARLARGLEKLRAAMDQRYRGDRKAWCHWLTVLGSTPPPAIVPHSSAPLTGVGGSSSTLAWVGVVALVAAAAVWRGIQTGGPEGRGPTAGQPDAVATPPALGIAARQPDRSSVTRKESTRPRRRVEELDEPRADEKRVLTPADVFPWLIPVTLEGDADVREVFEWTQYAGGPEHHAWREREDEVLMPVVRWFMPGCSGQPTLSGGELYTGGLALVRLDPLGGQNTAASVVDLVEGILPDVALLAQLGYVADRADEDRERRPLRRYEVERFEGRLRDLRTDDPRSHSIAGAPVLTPKLILARRTRDGGVSAFDRALEKRVWTWEPSGARFSTADDATRIPLCLASDKVVLVPNYRRLVALAVEDGKELWSFSCNGVIRMVPACADGRVFFGMDKGLFFALDLETGEEQWKATFGRFGWTAPVVLGEHVLCADRGGDRSYYGQYTWGPGETFDSDQEPGHLRALVAKNGRELWSTELAGFGLSLPSRGPDPRDVLAGFGSQVARFAVQSGKVEEKHRVKTAQHPFVTPTVVGTSLVFGALDGALYVHDYESGELRWAFRPPGDAKVTDFVHSGKRIYVATSVGLFCLGDDRKQAPPAPGFVLEWNGDTTKPFSAVESK